MGSRYVSVRACVTVSFTKEFQNRGHPVTGERYTLAVVRMSFPPVGHQVQKLCGAF